MPDVVDQSALSSDSAASAGKAGFVEALAAASTVTLADVVEAWRNWPLVELAELAVAADRRERAAVSVVGDRRSLGASQEQWLAIAAAPTVAQRGWLVDQIETPRGESSLQRLQRIAALPRDPRDAPALLALARTQPHRSKEHQPFWTLALKLLHQVADARVLAALPELTARPAETEFDTFLAGKLSAITSRPPFREWPKATPRELELLARVAARLDGGAVEKTAEDFLADIWAHPDDDAPREVYGDWLQQRGDPRGQLIALQMQRHRGSAETAKQERALLVEHGRQWLGPLEAAVSNQYTFERGFVFRCKISWRKLAAAPHLFKHPAWGTVREYILDPAGEKTCDAWLDHMIVLGAKRK